MEKVKKQRCLWIDVVKGFAILCMVYAHSVNMGQGLDFMNNYGYYGDIVSLAIYSFHMPVLMIISGYFFKRTADKLHGQKMLINRVQVLLVPTLLFCIFNMLLYRVPATQFFYYFSNALWFLWAIFVASLYTVIMRRFPIAAFSVCLVLPLFPDNYYYFNTHLWKYMLPYFLIGFYWNEYDGYSILESLLQRFRWLRWVILGLLGALWLWLMTLYRPSALIYYSGIYIFNGFPNQWLIDSYRYVIGLIGSLFFIWIGFMFFNTPSLPEKILGKLGRSSIWIYFFSSLIGNLQVYFTQSLSPMPLLPLAETIIMLGLCLMTEPLIRKIPYLGKWILGGR